MLRAIIELVPFGFEGDKRTLSVVEIANIGPTKSTAPCACIACACDDQRYDYACRWLKDGKVLAWAHVRDHHRSDGAEILVSSALTVLWNVGMENAEAEEGAKQ